MLAFRNDEGAWQEWTGAELMPRRVFVETSKIVPRTVSKRVGRRTVKSVVESVEPVSYYETQNFRLPRNAEEVFTDLELAGYGLYRVAGEPAPDGMQSVGYALIDAAGSPRREDRWEPIPPPPVPSAVSRRQFLSQLHIAGLTAQVHQWLQMQDALVIIAFNESAVFDRATAWVGLEAVGLSSQEIDEFYCNAAML